MTRATRKTPSTSPNAPVPADLTSPGPPHLTPWPLRFYTRLRFHLVQNLAREKCYFSAFLVPQSQFLSPPQALLRCLWRHQSPGADPAAQPGRVGCAAGRRPGLHLARTQWPSSPRPLRQRAQAPTRGRRELPLLDERLALPVQRILDLTLEHIRFLEAQVEQVDHWIATEAAASPRHRKLATIPGVGPVFSSGIGAEIGDTQRFLQGHKWDKKRKRYRPRNLRDAEDAVAKIAGLWWPRSTSGDFEAEDRRMAKTGNRYLRYYLIQAANLMRQNIPEYADFYARKYREASKHHHKRALVLTARKSVGLVVGLLHRNEPYRSREHRLS